jgi:hypothetical protein
MPQKPYEAGTKITGIIISLLVDCNDKDFHILKNIGIEAGYQDHSGIEYEGEQYPDRKGGVVVTKKLPEKCMAELSKEFKA